MVINEKALTQQMLEAYKGGGYTVIVRPRGSHAIICGYWAVDIDNVHVPREVLSLLALHMGLLPESGEAYKVTKTKDGPNVQKVIYDVAAGPLHTLEQMTEEAAVLPVVMRKTNITYDGCNVWQKDRDCGIFLLDPEYERILRKKDVEVLQVDNALYAEGSVSKAYIMRVDKDPNEPQIKHLSAMKWTVQ